MTEVLAVDGGQSAVRVRHSGSPTIAESEGVSRLEGDPLSTIAGHIEAAWRQLGEPRVDRAVLGLTTAPTDREQLDRLAYAVAASIDASDVWICDDSVTAHLGALSGDWGVSLTAGTGVACLGVTSSGDSVVVDGHGYLLGDDGGGFWVGREGLRAVLRHADGRAASTALTARAVERFGPIAELPIRVHGTRRAVNEIAQFAVEVLAMSSTDDVARGIVTRAADALAATVAAAVGAVKGQSPSVPVALGGRLLSAGSPLLAAVETAIHRAVPLAITRQADASPLEGALLLGAQAIDPRRAALIHRWKRESS